jgi:hypothetical protein
MDTRGLLASRRRPPIRIPLRPAVTVGTSSIQVASASLAGSDGLPTGLATDLTLENLGMETIEARVSFAPSSGVVLPAMRLSLSPMESLVVPDCLGQWFGMPEASGALTLEAPEGTVSMSARTYLWEGGSGEGRLSSLLSREEGEATRFVAGLSQTDSFSTLIRAANMTVAREVFAVRLRSAGGVIVGAREGLSIASGESGEWTLRELFPEAYGEGLTMELSAGVGSNLPAVRAAVTDLRTGSRVTLAAERAGARVYLPVNGRTAGSGDTFFSSDVAFANTGGRPLAVRVRFLERQLENTAARTATLLLGPGETLAIEDVLGKLFGLTEVAGFLEASSEQAELVVAARQAARSESAAGTVRATIATVTPERFSTRSLLLAAVPGRALAASRVGLLNPDDAPLPAVLRWLDPMGAVLAETAVVVPGRGIIEVAGDAAAAVPGGAVRVEAERPHFAFLLGIDRTRPVPGEIPPRERVVR